MKTVRCASLELPTNAADSATVAVWVQIAKEGDFRGYPGGPFRFTGEIFGQIVRNFRQHPAYARGESDVVPWDFHHASEMDPTLVATNGAPAQGWVRELDVRLGKDGAELWALTRWLEPARSYIKSQQYKWASVVVLFDARDPITNANVGAVLTSVALTNQPFIEGMAPLVAATKAGIPSRVAASRVVHVTLPSGVSPRSPEARAFMSALGRHLSTARVPAETDDDDSAPATAEEQAAMNHARRRTAIELPAKLNATACAGRNSVERAITCMRQHSAAFAALAWEEQVSRAADAIRLGFVTA